MRANRIQNSINAVLRGELELETRPNYCLRAVRQVVEHANGWKAGRFFDELQVYDHYTALNRQNASSGPWARSAEEAVIGRKWTVPGTRARPGDLVFSRQPATYGHVGIVGTDEEGKLRVLENATVRRGRHLGGSLNWVPFALWTGLTTVGRLPVSWVFDPEPPAEVPQKIIVSPKPQIITPAPSKPGERPVRVLVTDFQGNFIDRTGQRSVQTLPDGRELIVNNSLEPGTVFVDIREERNG